MKSACTSRHITIKGCVIYNITNSAIEAQQPYMYITLTCFIYQYTHQTPLYMDSAWRCPFVFYHYTKWITVESIKLPYLNYVINDIKRGEVKSILIHPQYYRDLIYVTGVPFYPFHNGPDRLQDRFQYRDGKGIISYHVDHQIDRKQRNLPRTKVFGLEM